MNRHTEVIDSTEDDILHISDTAEVNAETVNISCSRPLEIGSAETSSNSVHQNRIPCIYKAAGSGLVPSQWQR